jgi:phosphate transport system permease protein
MRRRRQVAEGLMRVLMMGSTALVLACFAGILFIVCLKGIPAMSWSMITRTSEGGFYLGREGGVLNAIVGSLAVAGGAVVIALFFSMAIALYLNAPRRRPRGYVRTVRFAIQVLSGVPSIVYGAVGFTVMLALGVRASLLGGMVTVAALILPIMVGLMDDVVAATPRHMMEASLSLGAGRWDTAFRVSLRQALPGVATAVLIAFGRGIGDAASVLFTAGYSDRLPTSFAQPVATLPLAVFFQLATPVAAVRMKAYASALILTVIVLLTSIATRWLTKRLGRHSIR